MSDEFLADLIDHRNRVAGYMQLVTNELFRRACEHDNSKFSPAEYDAYREAFPAFRLSVRQRGVQGGGPESGAGA